MLSSQLAFLGLVFAWSLVPFLRTTQTVVCLLGAEVQPQELTQPLCASASMATRLSLLGPVGSLLRYETLAKRRLEIQGWSAMQVWTMISQMAPNAETFLILCF